MQEEDEFDRMLKKSTGIDKAERDRARAGSVVVQSVSVCKLEDESKAKTSKRKGRQKMMPSGTWRT